MAKLVPPDPQSASDYEDRTTRAVKGVLIEIGQILGSFKGKFAVIGGAVPWLLLDNEDMPHVGTLDVDLGLDAEALGDGEYVTLVEALMGQGYKQREELRRFQLVRVKFDALVNGKFEARTRKYSGWVAEVVQHCVDHCAGKLV